MKKWIAFVFFALLGISTPYAESLDKSIQADILMKKITNALEKNRPAEGLPFFEELEALDMPLPESFYFYYIDTLDKSGVNADKTFERAEKYLTSYGKKGKYYERVIDIMSRVSIIHEQNVRLKLAQDAEKTRRDAEKNRAYDEALAKYNSELATYDSRVAKAAAEYREASASQARCGDNCGEKHGGFWGDAVEEQNCYAWCYRYEVTQKTVPVPVKPVRPN